jgi:hypothetical protein
MFTSTCFLCDKIADDGGMFLIASSVVTLRWDIVLCSNKGEAEEEAIRAGGPQGTPMMAIGGVAVASKVSTPNNLRDSFPTMEIRTTTSTLAIRQITKTLGNKVNRCDTIPIAITPIPSSCNNNSI